MKKLFSLLLIIAMIFAMGTTAFAANVTVDVEDDALLADHTFAAYQIFSGNWDLESGNLSNLVWGNGINSNEFITALKADSTIGTAFASSTDAASVADVLSTFANDSKEANTFAKVAHLNVNTANATIISTATTELDDGYYLIVDTTNVAGQDKVANASLLQVVGKDISIGLKTDKPSVEKKVMENVKWTDNAGYNDVADWSIGDTVPFKVTSKVPDMTYYNEYTMIFHDTMDAGFTLNSDSITVKIGNVTLVENTDYTLTQNGQSFDVAIENLKAISGISKDDAIVVDYTAVLNENAVIGLDGNVNVVYLEYSNEPNSDGIGDTSSSTGKTPEDKVIVFTYGTEITKIDGVDSSIVLEGAEFILKNADGTKYAKVENNMFKGWTDTEAEATTLITDANGVIIVRGLDDDTYLIEETKAPNGYNAIVGDKEIIISATTVNGDTWDGVASNALKSISNDTDNDGLAEVEIVNNKGAILPETGSTGTAVFITVGSIMVIAAVVFLVVRKRMSVYED